MNVKDAPANWPYGEDCWNKCYFPDDNTSGSTNGTIYIPYSITCEGLWNPSSKSCDTSGQKTDIGLACCAMNDFDCCVQETWQTVVIVLTSIFAFFLMSYLIYRSCLLSRHRRSMLDEPLLVEAEHPNSVNSIINEYPEALASAIDIDPATPGVKIKYQSFDGSINDSDYGNNGNNEKEDSDNVAPTTSVAEAYFATPNNP